MTPKRLDIPQEVADKLLVSCKHLCCRCERPFVQIHHIDGDPTNNDPDNLIPLCNYCHQEVHSNIPLARKITPEQLKLYRKSHIEKYSKPFYPSFGRESEGLQIIVAELKSLIKEIGEKK